MNWADHRAEMIGLTIEMFCADQELHFTREVLGWSRYTDLSAASGTAVFYVGVARAHDDGGVGEDLGGPWGAHHLQAHLAVDVLV